MMLPLPGAEVLSKNHWPKAFCSMAQPLLACVPLDSRTTVVLTPLTVSVAVPVAVYRNGQAVCVPSARHVSVGTCFVFAVTVCVAPWIRILLCRVVPSHSYPKL